ncbi:MAG TPA: ISNCY family transposase, partial [Thermoplasmatales archaeon]|nr:ISNCY family transposase [Thermoplasmatales archaeon]
MSPATPPPPLVDKATSFKIHKERGARKKLSLKQRVILLLLKEMFGKSNRMMASMLAVFSLLSDIDVSYKTIERLYSDTEVEMAIYN